MCAENRRIAASDRRQRVSRWRLPLFIDPKMFAPPMGIALGRCRAINFPESNLHSQPRLSRALHAKTSEGSVQFLVRRFRRQAGRAPRSLDADVRESVPVKGFRCRPVACAAASPGAGVGNPSQRENSQCRGVASAETWFADDAVPVRHSSATALGHDEPPDYGSTFKSGRGAIAAPPGRGALDGRSRREPSISASSASFLPLAERQEIPRHSHQHL